ncbi:MAG TPA: TonB-dependent receptor [Mucilaginibacter sp.]
MKFRHLLKEVLIVVCCLLSIPAFAQNQSISGKVTDQKDGSPLIGVSIGVKGAATGTQTQPDGTFKLTLPASGATTLVFSYIGYARQEVAILNKSVINVALVPNSNTLNDVVVVGFGTQRKKDLTGAIAIVNTNSLKSQPAASAAEALQGKAAGVNVVNDGSPGSTPQVRIRGYSTVNNNDPLYIIDGVPYQGKISWLNQNDIQSMQILKDASAASIYGSRANNGVIIITTTRGKEGAPKISFDAYYGTSKPITSTFPKFLTPMEYAQYKYQSYTSAGQDPGPTLGIMYGPGPNPVLPTYLIAGNTVGQNVTAAQANPANYNHDPANFYQITKANQSGTDWMKAITRSAPVQSYQLGASGGGKNSIYAVSMGYLNQQGIVDYTSFKRYNIRANTQFSAFDNRVRFGENLLFARTEGVGFATNTTNAGDYVQAYSPIGDVYKMQTIVPVYDIAGNFAGARGATLGDAKNPLAQLYRGKDNFNNENRLMGNAFVEIDIMKELTARTSFGAVLNNFNSQNIRYPSMEDAVSVATNGFDATQGFGNQWTWTNTLTYKHIFNKVHSLTVLAGTEAINNSYRTLSGSRDTYFLLGDLNYYYLNSGTANIQNSETGNKNTLASLFTRVDYAFKDKYLLSGTFRRDGSSNFGAANLYGDFPAMSAAWRVSGEDFMKSINWLNDLKLRIGYGETGNQNIPANNAYDLYQSTNRTSYYAINGGNAIVSGVRQNQIGNPNLQWEKLKSTNLGLDFSILNGSVDGSFDVYNKKTSGMLFPVALPSQSVGMATSPFQNVGSMQNKGFEAVLNYHSKAETTDGFRYDIGLNFAINRNKIIQLAPGINSITYGEASSGLVTTILKAGQPYGEFYGYKQAGIFQNAQEVSQSTQTGARVGGIKFADTNGDGVLTADDRTNIGSPLPDFTYGINLNTSYKRFDLVAFFYGSQGNKIYNLTRNYTDFQVFPSAGSARLLDAWSPTNTSSIIPSGSVLANPLEAQSSSYYIENGSYFRLKNLQLGYTFKNSAWMQKAGFSKIRVYGSVTNVFTITKYSGLDPEVSQYNTTFSLPGIDLGVYPNPRQFLIGINAGF